MEEETQDKSTHHCGHSVHTNHDGHCHQQKGRLDWLLWGSLLTIVLLYFIHIAAGDELQISWLKVLAHSVFDLINTIWWGIAAGILMISILGKVPREFVMSILGTRRGLPGILRATAAGVLLDLCSHGILMVGAKLYERGASTGQFVAFLVASPWNSFSLTLILIALVGLYWTLLFIALSVFIAIVTGLLFELLEKRGVLSHNPHQIQLPENFRFWHEATTKLRDTSYSTAFFKTMLWSGILESRMVLRWILFGVLLASLLRAFMPVDIFANYFGPTVAGLGLTLLAATILEVCSEGSTPIAADLLTRAKAPGNSFAFLMAGVATDYTEVMVVKDAARSWKVALAIPLLTLPQIVLFGWLINYFA